MNCPKQSKKPLQKESYSHPLIRNLGEALPEDHSKVLPTYQPIIPSHQNRTSSKILRYTTRTPSSESSFAVFVSPLHPITEELPTLSQVIECQTCGCKLNPHSKIQNYSELTCNLCGASSRISTFSNQEYKNNFAYQYDINSQVDEEGKKKKVCIVLEASQYSFERKMHKGVINAIVSLCDEGFDIAFMFFDTKYLYIIDQSMPSITKLSLKDQGQLQEWDNLPLSTEQMFSNISHFNQQIAQIIENIMYQAFYAKETVLSQVTSLLHRFLPKNCEVKYFITTLNNLTHTQETPSNTTLFSKIFREKQNQPSDSKGKQKEITKEQQKKRLSLNENSQFFVLTQNTTYQQAISLLGYNISKLYDHVERYKLEESVYYDLFQNLQTKWISNLTLQLRTSKCIEAIQPVYPSFDLYGRVKMRELPNDGRYKHYQITLNQCQANTMLPLKFKIKNATICDKLFFQISYHPSPSKQFVLNGQFLKVYPSSQMGLEYLDDESLFNQHLRNSLVGWDGRNFKQLREKLQGEYEQLIRLFKSNFRYDSINFPKTMKHYFLYIYSFLHKLKQNIVNSYTIFKMVHSNLETHSKQLYLRAYRLEGEELRNIKSNKTVLDSYPVVFMENGEELFMIFSDASVNEIKEIFGYFDTIPALANSNYELPQLTSNSRYRKAITLIRESNTSKFLRLKIVDHDSSFFDCYILPMLYDKCEHVDFLRKAWKNA